MAKQTGEGLEGVTPPNGGFGGPLPGKFQKLTHISCILR